MFARHIKNNVLVRLISLKNKEAEKDLGSKFKAKLELLHSKGISGAWLFVQLPHSKDYRL